MEQSVALVLFQPELLCALYRTERRTRVSRVPASYSGDPGFKSRLGNQLS
jgi:hypothetical protein